MPGKCSRTLSCWTSSCRTRTAWRFCDEIRRWHPNVPVVFITAAGDSDTTIESMQRGAMDYLRKPLDMARIREVVSQALTIGDMTREQEAESGEHGPTRPAHAEQAPTS